MVNEEWKEYEKKFMSKKIENIYYNKFRLKYH